MIWTRARRLGSRRVLAVLATVIAVLSIAACSSSKKPAATSSSGPPAPASSASSTPGATALGTAADIAAIKAAYVALFNPNTGTPQAIAVLQDGSAFESAVNAEGSTQLAKEASVTVSKVVLTSANQASVTFSVLINKSPILPNQMGYAIRQNGTWKVAGATFCALLQAQGTAPPACKLPAATSLPG